MFMNTKLPCWVMMLAFLPAVFLFKKYDQNFKQLGHSHMCRITARASSLHSVCETIPSMEGILFVWFDSLRPINYLSVIKGRVFLGWTSTKLGLMFLLKDRTQWRRWGSNPRPLGLESSTLPLSHCVPCPWKVTGPELKCLQRLSVEKTLANEDKILHFMAFDISLILSRVCLASICQFLFLTIFV